MAKVIEEILDDWDVFAVLPTGFGKSFCYGYLPWVFDELYRPAQPNVIPLALHYQRLLQLLVYCQTLVDWHTTSQ